MYNNIGGKIKGLAAGSMILGSAGFILVGTQIMSVSHNGEGTIPGMLIMCGGIFVSWISSLALYGFGELVDNSGQIVAMMKRSQAPVVGVYSSVEQKSEEIKAVNQEESKLEKPNREMLKETIPPYQPTAEIQHAYEALEGWCANGLISESDVMNAKMKIEVKRMTQIHPDVQLGYLAYQLRKSKEDMENGACSYDEHRSLVKTTLDTIYN